MWRWQRALCILVCCLSMVTGVRSSSLLPQSPTSIIALTNNKTEIQCAVREQHMDRLGIYWYRHHRGDFEFILYLSILDKSTYGSSISKESFTASRDSFRRMGVLKLSALQPADSGNYYCAVVVHTLDIVFGTGTELVVVDSFPTTAILTTSTPVCGCKEHEETTKGSAKKKDTRAGVACSTVIYAPLATGLVMLVISLVVMINHLHHFHRRYRRHFRKQLVK
ncbi:T-cell surface glycoprotein CD8 beta chain [Ambystoma mexicanum]|uniref:T-cell surface glycoprotein CD8 beta chain n=1 Tax=Ambystoma mexicanum TaxID=8296 RepID=UPI0037E8AC5B